MGLPARLPCLLGAFMVLGLLWFAPGRSRAAAAPAPTDGLTAQLTTANDLKTSDHARFLDLLQQLGQAQQHMTPLQREHLLYLEAWQNAFSGHYTEANAKYAGIVQRGLDKNLSIRAEAMLVHDHFVNRQYKEAYTSASALMAELPKVTDPKARSEAQSQVIQLLLQVSQFDLASDFVQQMTAEATTITGRCTASLYEARLLMLQDDKVPYSDPVFATTIDTCLAAKRTVIANAMRLGLADLMINQGQPQQAVNLLQRVAPDILKAGYQLQAASYHVTLASAWLDLGDYAHARKEATASLAASEPGDINWDLQKAYEVLYKAARARRRDAEALDWFEKYFEQYKAASVDAGKQAMAYQMVKQEVAAKKQKVAALADENRILQLRQALDAKAVETGRLYIMLLLLALAIVALWLTRVKHAQRRLRQLARHDGLTGAINRQSFVDEAKLSLQRLQKADSGACLVLLDLDYFKAVNDTHGHAAGDLVLQQMAQAVRKELRDSDVFARLGGEEFGVLMPACSCEQGAAAANRIRRALANSPMALDAGVHVMVSASFGVACSIKSGYTLAQLLRDADAAMYRAKRAGRNRMVVDGERRARSTG